jgi:hypothetical protein
MTTATIPIDHRVVRAGIRAVRKDLRWEGDEGSPFAVRDVLRRLENELSELAAFDDAAGLLASHQESFDDADDAHREWWVLHELLGHIDEQRRHVICRFARLAIAVADDLAGNPTAFTTARTYTKPWTRPIDDGVAPDTPRLPAVVADDDQRWDTVRQALRALYAAENAQDAANEMNDRHVHEYELDALRELETHGATWPDRLQDYAVAVTQLFAQHWPTFIHEQAH